MPAVAWVVWVWWTVPLLHASARKGNDDIRRKELFDIENASRQTLSQIATAVVALLGVYFLWGELNSTHESLRLEEESQITERFAQATDQLGSDSASTRLGGIYALEQLARDPRDPNQHWAAMQVLTTFVRDRAPLRSTAFASASPSLSVFDVEVEAVIAVLGRREVSRDPENQGLDLRGSDLRGVYFGAGALFQSTDFRGANLAGANLSGAHLEGADFRSDDQTVTVLDGAIMSSAHLEGARLNRAHLSGVRLGGAYLERTEFSSANLQGAVLSGADLTYAILSDAHLEGAVLTGADLSGTDLTGTHLEGANLQDATGLAREQLILACVDGETKLPEGIHAGRSCPEEPSVWSTSLAVLRPEEAEATPRFG